MDKEKLKKLPKWAQEDIMRIEAKLKRIEKELEDLYGKSKTNTSIAFLPENKPLPNGCTIDFKLKENIVSCNIVDGVLRIYGRNTISVEPRAANSIYIS